MADTNLTSGHLGFDLNHIFVYTRSMVKEIYEVPSESLIQEVPLPNVMKIHSELWTQGTNGRALRHFNCSIIESRTGRGEAAKGRPPYICSYRVETNPVDALTKAAICYLDKDFKPVPGSNKILDLYTQYDGYICDDVRLFWWGSSSTELCAFYTDRSRMHFGRIEVPGFKVKKSYPLELPNCQPIEKNWSPFWMGLFPWFVYKIKPHVVFSVQEKYAPLHTSAGLRCPHHSKTTFDWEYGEPHGGAPPIKCSSNHKDPFYHFFQSSLINPERGTKEYYLGCYRFNGYGNFDILDYVPTPILKCGELTDAEIEERGSMHRALTLFPCGVVYEEDTDDFLLSYGDRDLFCKIARISRKSLNSQLVAPIDAPLPALEEIGRHAP